MLDLLLMGLSKLHTEQYGAQYNTRHKVNVKQTDRKMVCEMKERRAQDSSPRFSFSFNIYVLASTFTGMLLYRGTVHFDVIRFGPVRSRPVRSSSVHSLRSSIPDHRSCPFYYSSDSDSALLSIL